MGDVYQFLDQDSNLDGPYDWYDEITNLPGTVPGTSDTAIIQYGQLLTGTLNVASIVLAQGSGAPALSLTGAGTQIISSSAVVAGTAELENGANLSIDTLQVSGGGSALILQSGASVSGDSSDNASITIGAAAGAALLSISGITTNFEYSTGGSLLVGGVASSNATISVTGGGALAGSYSEVLIGAADGATAAMIISGAGSVVEFDDFVAVGDEGTGSLIVEKGGYASLGGGVGVDVGTAGDPNASASGTITVTGASSLLSVDGVLIVGDSATASGQVSVSSGGVLDVSNDAYIYEGGIIVSGAGSVFDGRTLTISSQTLGGPNVTVSNGGAVNVVTVDLTVGTVVLAGGNITIRRSDFISAGTTISGHGTVSAGAIYNSGLLSASGGTMRFIGAVSQTGAAHIAAGATLQFDDSVGTGLTATFQAATGTLALGEAGSFAGVIAGFRQGDTIDLLGDAATQLSFKNDMLTVKNGSTTVAALAVTGSHKLAGFKLGSDGHGGTNITYSTASAAHPHDAGWHAIG